MLDVHLYAPIVMTSPLTNPANQSSALQDAQATKMKALQLLEELLATKAAMQTGSSTGRDLFAAVTGASAIDNAIAEVRDLIVSSDRVLGGTPAVTTVRLPAGRASIIARGRDEAMRVAM
jgi:hypothetical protein